MAIGENLYKSVSKRNDESVSLEKQLGRLEDDIRKLKIEFDIYFNGNSKRPPLESKARLEAFVKRVADNRRMSYSQRYQFNALMSRYTAYRELWRRMLRRRGEEMA